MTAADASRSFVAGIRVLDMTTALSGPFCTSVLGDLGAEVISVEPVDGDSMRQRSSPRDGVDYPFQMVHRNKRSIAVNIRDKRGAEVLQKLAGKVDVVVENFRPGVLQRYGLDAETLRALHPSLIYCSISGYGQTGPLSQEGGVDLVAQGHSGLMSVTGEPGGPPMKAGFPIGDLGGGMWGALGVLGALVRRAVTGEGATIDVALTDGLVAWSVWELAEFHMTGEVPGPLGSAHRFAAPYEAFVCADGAWLVLAGIPKRWQGLCDVIEKPELLDDPRFENETTRYANREALAKVISESFLAAPRSVWLEKLRRAGIPAGPIQTIEGALEDEQFAARDMWHGIDVDGIEVKVPNTPIKSNGSPGARVRAPRMGEHTEGVLRELGYDDETMHSYVIAGVVGGIVSDRIGGDVDDDHS